MSPAYYIATTPALAGPLLLVPFALGLLIYACAFCSQSHKRRSFGESLLLSLKFSEGELRGVQHTHVCLFTLLALDAFTAIFGAAVGVLTLTRLCAEQQPTCLSAVDVWLAFRWLSLSQHLITALVLILFLHRPDWASRLRIAGQALEVAPFLSVLLAFRLCEAAAIGKDIFNLLAMLAIAVSCLLKTSSGAADNRKYFGLMAACTYAFVCLPDSVFLCLLQVSPEYEKLAVDFLYVTNCYFVANALLFFFGLKINEKRDSEGAVGS